MVPRDRARPGLLSGSHTALGEKYAKQQQSLSHPSISQGLVSDLLPGRLVKARATDGGNSVRRAGAKMASPIS